MTGPAFARQLSQQLGYPVSVGEPFYAPGCISATCVFPNAIVPKSVWSAASANVMQFIPAANVAPSDNLPTGAYTSSANKAPLQDDKAGIHLDANSRLGMLSFYYFIDRFSLVNPFAGGSFGDFGGATEGQAQLFTIGDTKSFSSSAVNEFRLSYTRNTSFANTATGPAVDVAALGFTVGCDTLGICPQDPGFHTLPSISLNNFSIGGPAGSKICARTPTRQGTTFPHAWNPQPEVRRNVLAQPDQHADLLRQ